MLGWVGWFGISCFPLFYSFIGLIEFLIGVAGSIEKHFMLPPRWVLKIDSLGLLCPWSLQDIWSLRIFLPTVIVRLRYLGISKSGIMGPSELFEKCCLAPDGFSWVFCSFGP